MSQEGGELIGMGSFGCVFNPSLRCPDEKESKDDVVSKLFFSKYGKKELNEEYKINSTIKKIPGYEEWAEVWYKKCKTPEYIKLYDEEPEIQDCLEDNNIEPYEFNKVRMMLQGNYGGETFIDYIEKNLNKNIFSSKKKFISLFLRIMKSMKPLFIGLKKLYSKDIGHNDISNKNIVIDSGKCKFIDFGFSSKFSEHKFYKKRSSLEFISGRIYPPYPYEFIYLFATRDILKENDKKDIEYDIYRNLHDRYKLVHEIFFNRNTKQYLSDLINRFINKDNKRGYIKDIISLLDTYSLGILLPSILCSKAKKYNKISSLKKYLLDNKVKSFINLFRNMTEPDYFNRINPNDAYDKYIELEKIYLTKKTNDKKRTKRKT
jgi:hypothetical protein